MILEENRKKNHQIWNSHEGVILVTNFNSGLKRERSTIHLGFAVGPYYKDKE